MGLEGILAQAGGHRELADSPAEGGGSTGRQRTDMHDLARRQQALAQRTHLVIKETVENAARTGGGTDRHLADQLGGIDGDIARLLGNEDPAAQDSRIVDLVIDILPMEFDIGRGKHFLAPEAVERWELGIFKAGNIDPLE